MSRGPKQKIPVNAPQTGLNAAFSGLNLEGLPPGPAEGPEGPGESRVQPGAPPVRAGRVVLRREKAHRGGKTVLVVDGFGPQHGEDAIEALARRLRLACGAGGTVRERRIEIQGDQPGRVRAALEQEGFEVGGER
jgi:translation initiation factor 1